MHKNYTTYKSIEVKDRRDPQSLTEREQTQLGIDKLKEIYQKLSFCHHYPKESIKLLNRSSKEIESYLIGHGVSKHRIEDIFKDSIQKNKKLEDTLRIGKS
jgi:hypothetical protein